MSYWAKGKPCTERRRKNVAGALFVKCKFSINFQFGHFRQHVVDDDADHDHDDDDDDVDAGADGHLCKAIRPCVMDEVERLH